MIIHKRKQVLLEDENQDLRRVIEEFEQGGNIRHLFPENG